MTTPKMSRISGASKTMECIGAARVESRAVIAHRPRGPRTWLSGAADLVAPKSAFTGGSRAARMGGTGRRCTLATAAVDIRTPHSRLPNPGHQRTLVSSCGDPCSCVPACGISRDIPRASSPGCTAAHPVSSSIPAMLRRVAASTWRAAALPVPRSSRTPCHARRRMRSGRSAGLRPRAESRPATRLLLACLPAAGMPCAYGDLACPRSAPAALDSTGPRAQGLRIGVKASRQTPGLPSRGLDSFRHEGTAPWQLHRPCLPAFLEALDGLSPTTKKPRLQTQTGLYVSWQGKKDSNLRMLESKSSALTSLATPLRRRRL